MGAMRSLWLLLLLAPPLSASAQTGAPARQAPTGGQALDSRANRETFRKLLKEYKRFPEFLPALEKGAQTYDHIDDRFLDSLSEAVLKPRYVEFNVYYLTYLGREKQARAKIAELEREILNTPITNLKKRPQLEIKAKAVKDELRVIGRNIFLASKQANDSFSNAVATLTDEQRKAALAPPKREPPRLPGVFGGMREDRLKMKDAEKYNLTPVDDEFYSTALGKKLESDLGGRAEAWSYDYGTDELYVKVGSEVGKVEIKQDGTARFVNTKVGPGFVEPRGSALKVDMLKAKGKFLTGDKNDETLFGKYEKEGPKVQDEVLPPGHYEGDGHDHGHKH